jgi:hypothetical protein
VGIEAVYWGKPVILMGPAYYQNLGACYFPKDDADLLRLLTSELAPLSQTAAVKYGYSILGKVGTPFLHFDFSLFWPDLLLRKIVKNAKMRSFILKNSLAAVHRVASTIQTLCAKLSSRALRT